MARTNGIREEGGGGGDKSDGRPSPVVPLVHQQIMLLMRADCLSGAAKQALEAGDEVTAALMIAGAIEAFQEARELAERARAQ